MKNPKVSCYCATYGRVSLLEESVHSFLIQDYDGEKELIILNDFSDQTIYFDHPQIKIYNYKKKESLLGKKFNDCVKYCTGEILFPWEDDDIYLSNKISFSVNKMILNKTKIFHTRNAFYELNAENIMNALNYFQADLLYHTNLCIYKDAFEKAGGYYEYDGIDLDVISMNRFFASEKYVSEKIDIKDFFYLYRLSTTNSYHATWLSHGKEGISKEAEKYIEGLRKDIVLGDYYLNPHWKYDYEFFCRKIH
jgi:glycosyltransferase involved in cell wall biosynthesis